MRNAIKEWNHIKKSLRGKTILLFLDFDGTLAPIVSAPSRARLPPRTRLILNKLRLNPNVRVTVISGRDLDDIRRMTAIPGIIYAGNHGCQISGMGIEWQHDFPATWRKKLQRLRKDLLAAMKDIPGVLVEDKNMSLTVHYRNVGNRDKAGFQKTLSEISRPYIASLFIKPSIGKKVVEYGLATTWNKGKAMNWLIRAFESLGVSHSSLPVCIGDDVTDETGFKALRHKGITIHVGTNKQSSALYYLKNPQEVATFLGKISRLP